MDIYLSIEPCLDDLAFLFEVELPVKVLTDWNDALAIETGCVHTVVFSANSSEFPVGLSFQQQSGDHEQWLLKAARSLSIRLRCRSLYTGNPVEPDNPFLCVVFDSGKAFLADDEGTELSEGTGKLVHTIKRIPELDAGVA